MKPYFCLLVGLLVASLTQAQPSTPSSTSAVKLSPRRPFVNYTEVGILTGRVAYSNTGGASETVENKTSVTAQTFNGVQLTPRLAVGGLIGLDWYTGALIFPVGAGIRFNLLPHPRNNVQLVALADAGYGFTWFNQSSTGYVVSGGWWLSPGVGLRVGKPGGAAFLMSIGYKRQTAFVQKPISANTIQRDEDRVYNRLALRLGISF